MIIVTRCSYPRQLTTITNRFFLVTYEITFNNTLSPPSPLAFLQMEKWLSRGAKWKMNSTKEKVKNWGSSIDRQFAWNFTTGPEAASPKWVSISTWKKKKLEFLLLFWESLYCKEANFDEVQIFWSYFSLPKTSFYFE